MNFIGKKVVIVGNSTNHRWKKGTVVTISHKNNVGCCGGYDECDDEEGYAQFTAYEGKNKNMAQTIARSDFELHEMSVDAINTIIVDIEKSIVKKKNEISMWNSKIDYLKETGGDVYNEDEWKAYQILKTINEGTSDIEKAKLIAKIVNG